MNQTTTTSQLQQSSLPLEGNNKRTFTTKSTFRTFKIEFHEALKDLKRCNFARIDGNEFSCSTLINHICGCQFEEVFKVFLTDENEERQCFTCRETSGCCERTWQKKNNRDFSLNCFYIEESVDKVENKTKPFMLVKRINGGCCPGRAIIDIMDGEGDKIGYVKEEPPNEGNIATIYDKRNVPLYEIKTLKLKPRIEKTQGNNCLYLCCCCGCCGLSKCCKKQKKYYEEFNPIEDNNFKIFNRAKEEVGEIRYPCSIEFTKVEDPIDRFLIILCRIFMVYFLDRSDTFVEKAYDAAKDRRKDVLSCCCPCCGCC